MVMSTPLAREIVSAVSFSKVFQIGRRRENARDEVEGLRSLHCARSEDRQHAAFAWRKRLAMVDTAGDIGRQEGRGARLASAASDDGPKLFDGLQRLALAAREAMEDLALVFGQFFADDRDQEPARQDRQLSPASNRPK